MLRTLFVLVIAAFGTVSAFTGAFNGLLYYLWLAHFRPESWVWGDLILNLNLSLIAGVITLVASLLGRERFRFDGRVALLFGMFAISLTSTLLSPHFDYSWPYFLDFAKSLVITYLIAVLVTDYTRYRRVLIVIALSLGFEATKQGWAQLILNPGAQNANALPTLGDNNGVAVGMFMLLGLILSLAGTATRRWERRAYQVMALGVLYRGLSTYSRGGLLSCVAVVLWYALRSRQKVVALGSMLLAALLVLPVLPSEFWQRMETINTAREDVSEADDSVRGRLHFWSVALAMAADRPLLGVGHNAFAQAYDAYDPSGGLFGVHRSVHSSWLGALAELGYPGLVLFVLNVVMAFRACFRIRAAAGCGGPPALVSYSLGLEIALAAFVVGGSFVIFQFTELLWHVFGLTMALENLARQSVAAAQMQAVSSTDAGLCSTAA